MKRIYVFSLVAGLLAPVVLFRVIPAMKELLFPSELIEIDSLSYQAKMNFLAAPSVDLLDSIKANEFSCLCHRYQYNDYIYYWIMKDSNRYGSILPEEHHLISLSLYHELRDSMDDFSPNADMIQFAEHIKEYLNIAE